MDALYFWLIPLLRIVVSEAPGADPEISFGGPRGAEGAEVERRRHEDQGAEGVFPCPPGEGSGKGAVPPPQKFFFNIAL